jgi:hypothetical protein
MHPTIQGFQSKTSTFALILMLAVLWLLLRGYHGIVGDGQIYALQALARIQPHLAADLYLKNASQDQFTIFSPFYAWFIELLGLERAARLLTLLFTIWFLAAAWSAARALAGRDGAWLAVALLLIVTGSYGGSGVFGFSEQFLTARLPAEALVATSLACYARGFRAIAIVIATGALFIHPLIALPGLLLLICLFVPIKTSVILILAGLAAAFVVAVSATNVAWLSHVLPVMDPAWLDIVRERSQFLFLQLWSFRDWKLNAHPFFYLAFTALAMPDMRVRKLCLAAALVGAAGLGVALVASFIGPVAFLVQGQAWRWVWISAFVAALLLPATVLTIWRDYKCGPLCSILLVSGWTLSAVDGTACVSLAMVLWVMRANIGSKMAEYLRWLSLALLLGIVIWILVQSSRIVASSGATLTSVQEMFGLKISTALCAALLWWWARGSSKPWAPSFLVVALFASCVFLLPAAFKQSRTLGAAADVDEFSDWRRIIPPTSTVLVLPPRDVGAFVWFTLQRPNYLALDQSAGVVFSRATAMEVLRRSDVLLPVMDPDWKILTNLRESAAAKHKVNPAIRPLSAVSLAQICADPALDFVISPHDVGDDPFPKARSSSSMRSYLYDCRHVDVRRALPGKEK